MAGLVPATRALPCALVSEARSHAWTWMPGMRPGGRASGAVETTPAQGVNAGAAALAAGVARAAAEEGIDGLAFLRGVPGAIGGALRMNAGAQGGEIKDALVEATALDRNGAR